MRSIWIVHALKILIFLMIVIAGLGQAVLQLWNWLMPGIFGLPSISFWQAVGLLGLSWILFGGLRGAPLFLHSRRSFDRWEKMTPEQREQFRKGIRLGCGRAGKPADVQS